MTATGCTQDTDIHHLHDETLTLPIHEHLQLHVSQYKQKTQHPSHPLHKYTTYFNTPRLKHYLQQRPLHTNIPTDLHTITTTDMCHMHTSIVSMHLATRGNNKILRTPPHISSSKEALPHLTYCTLAQLRTNKSPFLKSYLHKVDVKSHPSPLCPLCNIHTHTTHIISLTAPTYTPHCYPWICDGIAVLMDGEDGWWTTSGKIGLPQLARGIRVGKQQQEKCLLEEQLKDIAMIEVKRKRAD